jgi:hypothetical protein
MCKAPRATKNMPTNAASWAKAQSTESNANPAMTATRPMTASFHGGPVM